MSADIGIAPGHRIQRFTAEVPGANGQGKTKEECLSNLSEAIGLILEDRRQDALRGIPEDATTEVVSLE